MEKEVISALIAWWVSLVVAVIWIFVSKYQLKKQLEIEKIKLKEGLSTEIQKIEKTFETNIKQEIFKSRYDHDKRLLEERLKYYPELFAITQEIGKQSYSAEENFKIIPEAKEKFLAWRNIGTGYLLLTQNSLPPFNELKEALKKDPGDGKKWYTDKQLDNIFRARNALRWALKDDIGIKIDDYKD